MSRYLVIGDPVVTLDREAYIPDGALIVEDRTIVEVGPRSQLEEKGNFDRVLGSPDHFVMPGFINCHFHSEGGLGQGLYELVFEKANIYVHSIFHDVAEEDFHNGILLSLIQAVRGGQTCVVDAYYGNPSLPNFGMDAALSAYQELGLRTAFGMTLRDQNIYVHEDNESFLRRLPPALAQEVRQSPMGYAWPVDEVLKAYDDVVKRWDGRQGRIRVILAPDWTPACSDEIYQRCRRLATEYGTGITTHVLETRLEMQFNLKRYGKVAMRRLADLGVLGPDVSCAHFVWATDEDIRILADTGAVAVNDPGSNLRLATGICRVRDILDAGGRIAFGTDAISFSDREDFFQEFRLSSYLQRLPPGLDTGRLSSERLLRAMGSNGALAARAEGKIGSLAAGKEADLLIVRKDRIFWPPARWAVSPLLDVIIDRTDATDLDTVMIGGQVVLDQGRITTVNEEKLRAAFAQATEKRLYELPGPWKRWAELALEVEPYLLDFYRPWAQEQVDPGYIYNTHRGPVAR